MEQLSKKTMVGYLRKVQSLQIEMAEKAATNGSVECRMKCYDDGESCIIVTVYDRTGHVKDEYGNVSFHLFSDSSKAENNRQFSKITGLVNDIIQSN